MNGDICQNAVTGLARLYGRRVCVRVPRCLVNPVTQQVLFITNSLGITAEAISRHRNSDKAESYSLISRTKLPDPVSGKWAKICLRISGLNPNLGP